MVRFWGVSVRSGGFLGFCSVGRMFVGVQVVRWAAGCVLRFSLWSAAVLRFLGVRCCRIGFPFVGAIEVILTLYVAIIHC